MRELHNFGAVKKLFHRPWWLFGGDERCPVCHHRYPHRAGVRCSACDREVCAMCAGQSEDEISCTQCAAEGGDEPWQRARSGKG